MDKKVLIVDDEPDLAELLSYRLTSSGFTTIIASDGQEGLTKAKEESPDVIVLDEMMPKMDGFKVCALLKSDTRFNKIPIIMFTARSRDEIDTKLAEEVGFDGYVTKMDDFDVLLKKINELLGQNE